MEQVLPMSRDFISYEEMTREPDLLIAACQQGDREAFRILFELHKDRVYSIALHFSCNEAVASDITQQVFLKLFTSISNFHYQAEFTTWLYRIVVNSCIDEKRRWRRWVYLEDVTVTQYEVAQYDGADNYYRLETTNSVRTAIASLKPNLRLPIILKYVEGMSYQEIANAMSCSMGTVASRINRAHKLLAQKLQQYQPGSTEIEIEKAK